MTALVPNTNPCGDCAMCCKVTPIIELDSPAGDWCPHWKKKCTIYEDRFDVCKIFYCLWNLGIVPEELNPKKTKCVLAMYKEEVLIVYCDPAYPDAWEKGAMGRFLAEWPEKFHVVCGKQETICFPTGRIE